MTSTPPLIFHPGRPNQDAFATIRGFVHQVDVTIIRWLTLTAPDILELEHGEDIDRLTAFSQQELQAALSGTGPLRDRLLEQVKSLERPITLRTSAVQRAVIDFAVHRWGNSGQLHYLFTTTASVVRERTSVLSSCSEAELQRLATVGLDRETPGIELWGAVRRGHLPPEIQVILVQALQRCLAQDIESTSRPEHVTEAQWNRYKALLTPASHTDFLTLIQDLEFNVGQPGGLPLRQEIECALVDHNYADGSRATRVYEHLFARVFQLLSQSGPKRLTTGDLQEAIQATGEADQAFVNAFTAYLDEDASNRLDDLNELWRTARYAEIVREVQRLREPTRWAWLDPGHQIRILKLSWRLELVLQRGVEDLQGLQKEIDALGGESLALQAATPHDFTTSIALLEEFKNRPELAAIHAAATLQLQQNAINERGLRELVDQGLATAETHRLLACGALQRGDVPTARQQISLALACSEADEMTRLTSAVIAVQEALSPVVWHSMLPQPQPNMQVFVRQDTESQTKRRDAAATFQAAVEARRLAGGQGQVWATWLLACLADDPDRQTEAATLAQTLISEDPTESAPWLWALNRDLKVEVPTAEELIQLRLVQEDTVDLRRVHALALTVLGHAERASWPTDDELPDVPIGDPLAVLNLPKVVRSPLAAVHAWMTLAIADEWSDAAPHSLWFAHQVQTGGALHMASVVAFNAGDFTTCRLLLTMPEATAQYPDGVLPRQLQELLAEAYARTEDLPAAAALAETLARGQQENHQATLYLRLLIGLGDDARLQTAAVEALRAANPAPGLVLALMDQILDDDPDLAQQLWYKGDTLGYPDELLGWAIRTAHLIGLENEGARLLNKAWLAGPERTGIVMGTESPIEARPPGVDGPGFLEVHLKSLFAQQQRRTDQGQQAYESGTLPLAIAFAGQPIAKLITQTLRSGGTRLGLLGRHGGRPLPGAVPEVLRLTVDLSGFIVAARLGLLDRVISTFGPLRVTPFVMLALTESLHACRPQSDEEIWQLIQDHITEGRLQVLPENAPRDSALDPLGDWAVARPYLADTSGKVVDDLPVRLHQLGDTFAAGEGLESILPQKLLAVLMEQGLLDAEELNRAESMLWHPFSTPTVANAGETLFLTTEALLALAKAGVLSAAVEVFRLVVSNQAAQLVKGQWAKCRQDRQTREDLREWRRTLRSKLRARQVILLPHPGLWSPTDPRELAAADIEMIHATHFESKDAVWIEDRSVNAGLRMGEAQLWSLTDVQAVLQFRGQLTEEQSQRLTRQQREMGMGLTPTSATELSSLLASFNAQPTPELRAWALHLEAIRKFAPALRKDEGAYINQIIEANRKAMQGIWMNMTPTSSLRATWLAYHGALSIANLLRNQANSESTYAKAFDAAEMLSLSSEIEVGDARTAFLTWWAKTYYVDLKEQKTVAQATALMVMRKLRGIQPGARRAWLSNTFTSWPQGVQNEVRALLGL